MKFWSTAKGRITFARGSEWVCERLAQSGLTLAQWQGALFYPGRIGITPKCQIASTELKPRIPEGHLWYDEHERSTHDSWEIWFELKFYQRIYYWFHKSYRNPDGTQYKKPEICEWPGTKEPFGPLILSPPIQVLDPLPPPETVMAVSTISTVSIIPPLPRRRTLSPADREGIRQLTRGLCMYCRVQIGTGTWESDWDVDHVINFRNHPEFDALPNFGPACYECNAQKRDMPFATFLVSPWLLERQKAVFAEMKRRRRPGRE